MTQLILSQNNLLPTVAVLFRAIFICSQGVRAHFATWAMLFPLSLSTVGHFLEEGFPSHDVLGCAVLV